MYTNTMSLALQALQASNKCATSFDTSFGNISNCIALGADVNAADWKGSTALHYATKNGNSHVVRLLLEADGMQCVNSFDSGVAQHCTMQRINLGWPRIELEDGTNATGCKGNTQWC